MQVRPGTPDGPIRPDTERVANGGFDSGALAPWTAYGSATATVTAKLAGSFGHRLRLL